MPFGSPGIPALAAFALALAACGGSAPRDAEAPGAGPRTAPRPEDGRIVALYNGRPVTWREVAERAMEIDPKGMVEHYTRWRMVEDRKAALGLVTPPDEVRRRAETVIRKSRETMGEAKFKAQLDKEGLSEAAYLGQLLKWPLLADTLALEKIVRYQAVLEDTLEISRVTFADEKEARRFADACAAKGFDRASDEAFAGASRLEAERAAREVFPRTFPPPRLDPWTVEALVKMKPGDVTGVETSRANLFHVIKLLAFRPARQVSYAEARAEVLESILSDPPGPAEFERWFRQERAKIKVEYAEPARAPEKGR